jgi:hypothetical protein
MREAVPRVGQDNSRLMKFYDVALAHREYLPAASGTLKNPRKIADEN